MEIVIHGTKGGYKVLYPQNSTKTFVNDFRSSGATENPVGQCAYSLSFTDNGCVFSKYAIIRDELREMATGTIAVSVLVSNNEKLVGSDAISLLDLILENFLKINVKDNNLVHAVDDFAYVDEIKSKFTLLRSNGECLNRGQVDPAYIYYDSKEYLSKYFDMPYQTEYVPYSQIFFIDKQLENDPRNPLKVLRHTENSDLTNEIDFLNPEFSISFPPYVKVSSNGNQLSSGSKIKKNDLITINYVKKYHKPIPPISGKLFSEELKNYVSLLNNSIHINPIQFEPEAKFVKVKVKYNGHEIQKAKITIKNFREIEGSDIEFKGEEIGENYYISASIDDLTSNIYTLSPENQSEIILELRKIKPVVIGDEEIKNKSPFDANEKTKDNNLTKTILVALIVIVFAFVGLDYFMLNKFIFKNGAEVEISKAEEEPQSETRKLQGSTIISYIEGTEYLLESLEEYKNIWQTQKEGMLEEDWTRIDTTLSNAIEKRKDIDAFIFKSSDRPSKKTYIFTEAQKELKTSFIKLTQNETDFKKFKEENSDISKLTLKELNETINKFLDSKMPQQTGGVKPVMKKPKTPPSQVDGPGSKRTKS